MAKTKGRPVLFGGEIIGHAVDEPAALKILVDLMKQIDRDTLGREEPDYSRERVKLITCKPGGCNQYPYSLAGRLIWATGY